MINSKYQAANLFGLCFCSFTVNRCSFCLAPKNIILFTTSALFSIKTLYFKCAVACVGDFLARSSMSMTL